MGLGAGFQRRHETISRIFASRCVACEGRCQDLARLADVMMPLIAGKSPASGMGCV
jgi:hypothetical protein